LVHHTRSGHSGLMENFMAFMSGGAPGGWPGGGGYAPMWGGCKGQKSGPYGFGGKGKDKGKGKGKSFGGPKEEKPVVNTNQINPSKEEFDGGINFKNIFQEKLSKQIHRPMATGDLVYTCSRVMGGKMCTLTTPCLGPDSAPFESDAPGKDEKVAGQRAAAQALAALFPEVYVAVQEAYGAGVGTAGDPPPGGVDPNGEPKGLLNRHVQLAIARPVEKADIVYETKWRHDLNGYHCILKINALRIFQEDGGDGAQVHESELGGNFKDQKQAEKSAARQALEANATEFAVAQAAHEAKKSR